MNKKDAKSKQFLAEGARFADLFNYHLYDGEQILRAEDLEEKDTEELLSLYYGVDDTEITKQKRRDLLKKAVIANSKGICYVLLGIENQSEIHYAMPVRNMIYDAINYGTQVEEARRKHEEERRVSGRKVYSDNGEFLSGFTRVDKITPVVTLVVYWGSKKWDGPVSLHEMMDVKDEKILQYVPDYKMNLLEPCEVNDFSKFRTSVGEVLEVIKASDDMEKMRAVMENNEAFKHLETDAVRVINTFTKLNIKLTGKEKNVDMCKAWEDWKTYNYEKGIAQGLERGISEGRIEGRLEERMKALKNIMQNLNFSIEQALRILMIPEEEWGKYKELV